MGKTFEGKLDGSGLRVGIIVSRFNDLITERLLKGALDRLRRSNVPQESTDVCWVPGAFEVPKAAKHMATTGRYDGVIALAAVIRGATPHFEYISN
ncbi:TPA: 6,7-dimethyl-8-ribityllumazine synthase, partial [Candidatus Acetothermia bacterium]|nr:6,7-dimethyl-8-ribityllumazine synthase [Candidatus Acetothermia bacterium]